MWNQGVMKFLSKMKSFFLDKNFLIIIDHIWIPWKLIQNFLYIFI